MNKTNLENELGIDLTKTYSGEEVSSLVEIILEEADTSIQKAYYEGYKQANLELLPKIEVLKYQVDHAKEMKIQNYITAATIGFGVGCLTGGAIGFNIQVKL